MIRNIPVPGPLIYRSISNIPVPGPHICRLIRNILVPGPLIYRLIRNILVPRPLIFRSISNKPVPGPLIFRSISNIPVPGPLIYGSISNIPVPGPLELSQAGGLPVDSPSALPMSQNLAEREKMTLWLICFYPFLRISSRNSFFLLVFWSIKNSKILWHCRFNFMPLSVLLKNDFHLWLSLFLFTTHEEHLGGNLAGRMPEKYVFNFNFWKFIREVRTNWEHFGKK